MTKSLYETVLEALHARRGTFRKLAEESGVAYSTLHKISQLRIKNPGIKQIEAIARVVIPGYLGYRGK